MSSDKYIFLQADSSQAEARVVFLLANLDPTEYDRHDMHALTASWFFGGTEADYSKKVLGYEVPTRFIGKTLRHAGHLGAKARRAMLEVNTSARKYKIPVKINQGQADLYLKIFHKKSPNVERVFQQGVIDALGRDKRRLVAPLPYGIDAPHGGVRTFFERWGDELFRQAFSYIPQRAISENTKGAALRIRKRTGKVFIVESHDALVYCIRENELEQFAPIVREEMERPIDFTNCSLPRRPLVIPCELEVGYDYQNFKKFKLDKVA